jgi:hypothetical protein
MKSGNKPPKTPWEGRKFILEIIAVFISATAIVITVIMNRNQEQNNQNQFATVEARLGKLDQPNITAKIKVAFSPNYSQELDEQYLDRVGMKLKNVGYDFYNQSLEEYLNPAQQEQKHYLFIQFMNDGPGIAKRIRIDEIVWAPKVGVTAPAGLQDVIGVDIGIINANQMLTFLVDTAAGISPSDLLQNSHAMEICVEFSYTGYIDDTQWIQGEPLCLSSAGPGEIEPMVPEK